MHPEGALPNIHILRCNIISTKRSLIITVVIALFALPIAFVSSQGSIPTTATISPDGLIVNGQIVATVGDSHADIISASGQHHAGYYSQASGSGVLAYFGPVAGDSFSIGISNGSVIYINVRGFDGWTTTSGINTDYVLEHRLSGIIDGVRASLNFSYRTGFIGSLEIR